MKLVEEIAMAIWKTLSSSNGKSLVRCSLANHLKNLLQKNKKISSDFPLTHSSESFMQLITTVLSSKRGLK